MLAYFTWPCVIFVTPHQVYQYKYWYTALWAYTISYTAQTIRTSKRKIGAVLFLPCKKMAMPKIHWPVLTPHISVCRSSISPPPRRFFPFSSSCETSHACTVHRDHVSPSRALKDFRHLFPSSYVICILGYARARASDFSIPIAVRTFALPLT